MNKVRLKGWKSGLNKVDLNRLLREHANVSLQRAKTLVDGLLGGEEIVVEFSSRATAEVFREVALDLGVATATLIDEAAPQADEHLCT